MKDDNLVENLTRELLKILNEKGDGNTLDEVIFSSLSSIVFYSKRMISKHGTDEQKKGINDFLRKTLEDAIDCANFYNESKE